jgi:glycosyltransferase involved in cell wall biosynthesis
MLNDPESARAMAEKLYSVVRQQFTWREAAEQYAALVADGDSQPIK